MQTTYYFDGTRLILGIIVVFYRNEFVLLFDWLQNLKDILEYGHDGILCDKCHSESVYVLQGVACLQTRYVINRSSFINPRAHMYKIIYTLQDKIIHWI